ncbi:MAG TPA: hypothetical protein VMM78_02185 [Thermomicrobiales bacterium]|nr:hypothetical protein [Thermomicrobiales bacterium]
MPPERMQRQIALLQRLHGQECTFTGSVDGKSLVLDFGARHPTGIDEARGLVAAFEGDYWLVVQCPWRLDSSTDVIVGGFDSVELILDFSRILVGKRVRATQVDPPGFTAQLSFDDDLTLWLFPCDSTELLADDDADGTAPPWVISGRAIADG